MRRGLFFGTIAVALLAVACGSDGGGTGDSEQPSDGITVTGTYLLVDASGGCGQSFDNVGGVSLTFKDGAGTIIGTATTDAETTEEKTVKSGGIEVKTCGHTAGYSVDLPKVDFYEMTIEDESADSPSPMSYAELESKGFVWDIQLFTGSPLGPDGPRVAPAPSDRSHSGRAQLRGMSIPAVYLAPDPVEIRVDLMGHHLRPRTRDAEPHL